MTKPATFSGAKLEAARERANLTRAELAEKVGISRQMVRYLEQGSQPGYDVACRLADALGIGVEKFR